VQLVRDPFFKEEHRHFLQKNRHETNKNVP
jgi:hypothetical protein